MVLNRSYPLQRFPLIDILRAAAALLVVWYHVIAHGKWDTFPVTGLAIMPRIGWVGVDLFLVISGFVIGKTALESYARSSTWRQTFIDRRLRRIVPLHLATLFIFLFMSNPDLLLYGWESVFHVLTHVFFVHNLFPSTYGSINGVNWSVALEMQFYMLVALTTPWLARTRWYRIFLVWVAIAVAWKYLSTLLLVPKEAEVHHQIVAATMLPGTLDQFVVGICLAKLCIDGHLKFTPLRMVLWLVAAIALLAAALLTFMPRSAYWYFPEMIWFWRLLVSAGFGALLAVFIMIPGSGGWLTKPFRYLGEISYGIYLWHLPILLALIAKTPWRGWSLLKATMIATIILAALSWHGFEKFWMNKNKSIPSS